MLSVYFGNDTVEVREKAFQAITEAEGAGARVHRIEAEDFVPGLINDALGATSLFGETELYVFDTPSSDSEFSEGVLSAVPELAASSNQFFVIEGPLLAAQKKIYTEHATVCEELKTNAAERFNVFSLAEALLRKDKKSLWILFTKAKRSGLSDEEIIGTLWWQLKVLWLAKETHSPQEAGVKDYPYKKAKQALRNFAPGEVELRAEQLLRVYHEGHAGMCDTSLALERWVLTL